MFGLRLGDHPQAVVTTTPRPTPLVRGLIKSASTRITRGNTFANAANLAPSALEEMRKRYEGTRLGRQELYAELLDDVVGALWTLATIGEPGDMPEMQRIVVAVDPSGASGKGDGDDIGIVVCGKGMDGRFYVIEDSTCNLSPDGWGRRATRKYAEHRADCIVVEKNFGGAMAEGVIKTADRNAKVKMVTASRGKAVRAEPVAALYEQGRVTHARGLSALEDQMCVAKGTLVETQRGQVPIELITTHDLVMTRNGFASIKWVGYTGQATRLIQIETQNSRIRVTECHPIYLPKTREFVSAKFVNPMDQLLESPRWGNSERRLHGAENGITGCNPVITEMPKESYYTAPLMKRMWGSFLTAVMSIIRTKTRQTIDLTTLSASSPRRTSLFISELGLIFHILNLWGAVKSAAMSPLRYGLNLQIDSAQTPVRNAVIESRRARISPAGIFHANHAEQLSQPPQKGSGCSAMPNARMITHVKSQSSEGDPVYNISVADGFLPEYYANGILTHNCKMTVSGFMGDGSPDRVDALVWGISELMDGSSYSLTGIF